MLTKVTAYNPLTNLDPLVFNVINRPETDLFQVRNIDGLGAVKATVNTTPMGSVDKAVFTGSNFGERNIVLTLGLTPDWDNWTFSRLRRLIDKYFMPKMQTRLVFETMEFSPVEIFGYVEANEPNMFTKDPEHQISIICPDPDFTSVEAITIYGQTDQDPLDIDYEGNIETGFVVQVRNFDADPDPSIITIYRTNPDIDNFTVDSGGDPILLDSERTFMMNSISGQKFVKTVGATETNLLQMVSDDSKWLSLRQGVNQFQVISNAGVQDWSLAYYEHFGSL